MTIIINKDNLQQYINNGLIKYNNNILIINYTLDEINKIIINLSNIIEIRGDIGFNVNNIDISKCYNLEKVIFCEGNISILSLGKINKITYLSINNTSIENINTKYLINLEYLNISCTPIRYLNTKNLIKLKYLEMEYTKINNFNTENLKNLECLDCGNCEDLDYINFNDLSKLKFLNIENTFIDKLYLNKYNFNNLKTLYFNKKIIINNNNNDNNNNEKIKILNDEINILRKQLLYKDQEINTLNKKIQILNH